MAANKANRSASVTAIAGPMLAAVALFGPSAQTSAQSTAQEAAVKVINTGYFGSVAIKGYDPVSYFTEGRAVQGKEELTYEWLGAVWRFSSEEHKELFAAEPVKYAPQYGGYCAVGVADGTLTNDIDPEAWSIIDGKLYLSYSKEANDRFMNRDTILAADRKWREILAGTTAR